MGLSLAYLSKLRNAIDGRMAAIHHIRPVWGPWVGMGHMTPNPRLEELRYVP